MDKDTIYELTGIKMMVLVAGFLGGLIQLSLNPRLSIAGAIISVVAGVSCAAFVTPAIHFVTISPKFENGAAFFLGLIGMHLMAKVYEWFSALTPGKLMGSMISFLADRSNKKNDDESE